MASASSAPFMWAREDMTVTDMWACLDCSEYGARKPGDDSDAITHVSDTGHTTILVRESRQVIYPLNLRPPR